MSSFRFVLLDVAVIVRSSSRELLDGIALCYGATHGHEQEGDALLASAQPTARGWTISVPRRSNVHAPDLAAAIRSLNHELLHGLMLRRRDLFYIHAGVVAVGDDAVILPGLSRSGKSTLVLALVQQGARLLSDELLAYEPRSRTLLPFPRAIKIRDECVNYFPDLADRFVGEGEGRFLPPDLLRAVDVPDAVDAPGAVDVESRAIPKLVVVPQWQSDAANDLRPLSNGEGLIELTKSALNFGTHRQRSVDHLTELAWAASCFRLTWNEPHAAAALVLESLRRQPSDLHS